MTDYSTFATPSGDVYVVTIGADGLIHGLSNCHLDALATHLANVTGTVPVMPAEAAKFAHGTPFALVNGAVVPGVLPLAQVQTRQVHSLRAAGAAAIRGGYSSAALGTPHTYPTQATDQSNMIASVTASLLPGLAAGWATPFWCADGADVWAMRPHTAAQIQQAGTDGKAAIVAAQEHLASLVAQVSGATTADQVAAIAW